MQKSTRPNPGSQPFRIGIICLSILLSILFYWLLGFVLNDISSQNGPRFTEIQNQYYDAKVVQDQKNITIKVNQLNQNIDYLNKQQTITNNSINSYRDTMNQLLGLQKASIEKGIAVAETMKTNLADTTNLYLQAQTKYQAIQEKISILSQSRQTLQNQRSQNEVILQAQSSKASQYYNALLERFNLQLAFIKLVALIPLLLLSAYLLIRDRKSIYRPIILAFGISVILKVVAVMHEFFPSRYFKYIFIILLILLTLAILQRMLRMMVTPRPDWLLKQFKDSYKRLQCPGCQFPVRPGSLKFIELLRGTKRFVGSTISTAELDADYSCPSCGEQIFEHCVECKQVRHSLLPYCEHCRNKIG